MRKFLALTALVLGLAACQTETNIFGVDVNTNEKAIEFTVNVTAPELETRAADWTDSAKGGIENGVLGTTQDDVTLRYILDIYDANGERSKKRYFAYADDRNVSFSPRLIPGRKYTFAVWADFVSATAKADVHYDTSDLKAIKLKDAWAPMDETRDAYTGFTTVDELLANQEITVNLTRPFAKLRVITTDIVAVDNLHVKPGFATVNYTTAYRYQFDATTGQYTAAGTAKKSHLTFEIKEYSSNTTSDMTLFTDYLFAPVQDEVVEFNLSVYDAVVDENSGIKSLGNLITTTTFNTSFPVKRNVLTTIRGNFLTIQGGNFTVNVVNNDAFASEEVHIIQ